jgi:hypothetical protein
MNNLQFTGVLNLWKERVIAKATGRRAKGLQRQYEEILNFKDARDTLAPGMWHWSTADFGRISTVRIRKQEVITSHFSVEALGGIADRVATINFKIQFPGGLVDIARVRLQESGHISRRAMATFAGAKRDPEGYRTDRPARDSSGLKEN